MRALRIVFISALAAGCLVLLGCPSYRVPRDYVPDEKVVFLMQRVDLGPIRHPLVAADPYTFAPWNGAVDAVHPLFLRISRFATLLEPDFSADSRTYKEAQAYFGRILALPLLATLRARLDAATGPEAVGEGADTITFGEGWKSIETPQGFLRYSTTRAPQYHLEVPGQPRCTLFVGVDGAVSDCMVESSSGIRFDWTVAGGTLSAKAGDRALAITSDMTKRLMATTENEREWSTTSSLSIFFPEGIRITNLDGPGAASAVIVPAWPERYRRRTIGPFDFLYTAKDEPLLARVDATRLAAIDAECRALTGLAPAPRRVILLPPSLESFRRLHAREPGEVMTWYPSGFEARDYITMWPPSVPRYADPAGEGYFWGEEFYEIVAHEYVHVMVGEASGIFSRVPVWLNEGLAVYAECSLFPEAKQYWETTFAVSHALGRLLPWDDVTRYGTGAYPIDKARVHYAQSYAMVSALVARYGTGKIAEYVQSFREPFDEAGLSQVVSTYRGHFLDTFKASWTEVQPELVPDTPQKK
jgi:hypothetical protein